MALSVSDLRKQLNLTGACETTLLTRLLAAATAHVERLLGFRLDDEDELPDGPPADLELAVLQLAADWYENREASLVGASAQTIPIGVAQIVNEYRRYTFGACDE
jgi:hypothetical protein